MCGRTGGYPKDARLSFSLLLRPLLFLSSQREEARGGSKAPKHARARGASAARKGKVEEMEGTAKCGKGECGIRPAVGRSVRWTDGRRSARGGGRGGGEDRAASRQGGRHSRPIIIIARHNSAGLSTSPGTDWAIEPPSEGRGRVGKEGGKGGSGVKTGEGLGEDYRLLRGRKEKKGLRGRNCPPLKESHRTTHKFISNLYITAHYLNPPRTSSIVSLVYVRRPG